MYTHTRFSRGSSYKSYDLSSRFCFDIIIIDGDLDVTGASKLRSQGHYTFIYVYINNFIGIILLRMEEKKSLVFLYARVLFILHRTGQGRFVKAIVCGSFIMHLCILTSFHTWYKVSRWRIIIKKNCVL